MTRQGRSSSATTPRSGLRRFAAASAVFALAVSALAFAGHGDPASADPLAEGETPVAWRTDYASWHRYPGAIVDAENPTGHLTVNPGRIWTDKTVIGDDEAAEHAGVDHDLDIADDEMAVVLSALGTTRQVTSTRKPVIDLVLVLDNSYSMTQCLGTSGYCTSSDVTSTLSYRNSRAYAMVEGVNAAIAYIRNADPEARVSMVAFGTGVTTLTPLAPPQTVGTSGDYLQFVAPVGSSSTMSLRVAGGTMLQIGTVSSSTQSTNIHRGIDRGISVLADQSTSSVAGDVQHIPSMILFSDGEPTYSANEPQWWNLANTANQQGPGQPTATQYYGNGFLAALSAAYGKKLVRDVYNDEAYNSLHGFSPVDMNIYSVGLGMSALQPQGKQLAFATLDPRGTLPAAGATNAENDMATSFGSAMSDYESSGAGQRRVVVNSSGSSDVTYTVNRPSGQIFNGTRNVNAIAYNPTYEELRYNTSFDAPETGAELVDVFEAIAQQVLAEEPTLPIETTTPDPNTDGYVTFTDELGPFMRVSKIDSIVFCSLLGTATASACDVEDFREYTTSTSDGVTTYVFAGSYTANDIFPLTPLSNIVVQVRTNPSLAVGDIVTVRLPVALLPMINASVVEDALGEPQSMRWWESHPVHVYYKVAPKPGIARALTDMTALPAADQQALASYIATNTAADGRVRFYANAFDTVGGTRTARVTARFQPSSRNDFYRFAVDSLLYSAQDAGSTITQEEWDDLPGTAVVYRTTWQYTATGDQGSTPTKTLLFLPTTKATLEAGQTAAATIREVEGRMVAPAGLYNLAPRVNNLDMPKCSDDDVRWSGGTLSCADVVPASNRTGTDPFARQTRIVPAQTDSVEIRLGNNGWLEYDVPGAFEIAKTVGTAQAGLTPDPEQQFTFTVTLTAAGGAALAGQFPYAVYESADGTAVGSGLIANGGTIPLLGGQHARILGLPDGARYSVVEAAPDPDAYEIVPPGNADGTIDVPQTTVPRQTWHNVYDVRTTTIATVQATKTMTPSWRGGPYVFDFCRLDSDDPLPAVDEDTGTDCVSATITGEGQVVGFGSITFARPGTYSYGVVERPTGTPGVTQSRAQYRWEVQVGDNGDGSLSTATTLTRVVDDANQQVDEPVAAPAVFTNTWTAETLSERLAVVKRVTDSSRGDAGQLLAPRIPYDFRYSTVDVAGNAGAPLFRLDDGSTAAEATVRSVPTGLSVPSPPLQYTQDHVGHVYYYRVEELPFDPPMDGLTMSTAVWFFAVDVRSTLEEDGEILINTIVRVCETTQDEVTADAPWGGCDPAAATYGPEGEVPVFVNAYDPDPVQVQLGAIKTLDGRPWSSDEFTFDLAAEDEFTRTAIRENWIGLPTDLTATATAAAPGANPNVVFGAITFTRVGTYRFQVTERAPSPEIPGVTADAPPVTYEVTVTDALVGDGTALDGRLEATVSASNGADASGDIGRFVNPFRAVTLYTDGYVTKTLNGRASLDGEFSFEVAALDSASQQKLGWDTDSQTFVNETGGIDGQTSRVVTLPSILFTQDDLGQSFRYRITESDSGAGGVIYDDTVYVVTIEPQVDVATGQLWVRATVDDGSGEPVVHDSRDGEPVEIGFVNAYEAEAGTAVIPVQKRIVGRDWRAGDSFAFELTGVDGAPLPADPTVVITPESAQPSPGIRLGEFGPIPFAEPGEYTYEIREVPPVLRDAEILYDVDRVVTITVRVWDDGSGVLQTEVIDATELFENLYRTPYHFDINKRLVGRDMADGEFQIHVAPQSQAAADLSGIPYPAGVDVPVPAAADGELSLIQRVVDPVLQDGDFDVPYCYVYSEVIPDPPATGVVYDTSRYQICATFTQRDDGIIEIHSVVTDADDETAPPLSEITAAEDNPPFAFPEIAFQNTYNAWTLVKSSDPASGSTVLPGGTVTYTLTAQNTATSVLSGALAIDDLAGVLPYGTLGELPAGVTVDGDSLTWAIPDLDAGAIASVSYTVTVADDAVGVTLRNVVTGAGDVPEPEACPEDAADCREVELFTPAWSLVKSSDPASGSTVVPGDVVTYTLTAQNTSDALLTGALAIDDLSAVLPYATAGELPAGLALEGTTLTWTVPELAPGASASVSYAVTVTDAAAGQTLRNVVTGAGAVPPDPCPQDDAQCRETEHPVPSWTLAKSADPASGDAVRPGDEVTYTITATNTGPAPVVGAVARDDLSGVLSAAVLGELPPEAALSDDGRSLEWQIPDLAVGESTSISYTVTVSPETWGATLRNLVSGTGPVPPSECATDEPCVTEHPVPFWVLRKSSNPASGSVVAPGDEIVYRLTVVNDGPAAVTGAVVSDDLSGILANADVVLDPLAAGLTLEGTTLTWNVPTIAVGAEASITYIARVHAGAYDARLRNVASASAGGACDGACATEHETPSAPPPLPPTGGAIAFDVGSMGVLLLVIGGLLVLARRRRHSAARAGSDAVAESAQG